MHSDDFLTIRLQQLNDVTAIIGKVFPFDGGNPFDAISGN